MPKADNYICPRCEYNTPLKKSMKRHFYENKNPCSDRTGLELTDEIKEKVVCLRIHQKQTNFVKQIIQ